MVQLRREAQPAIISDENPMGTDGFEFVEFAHPDPGKLGALFELMGFSAVSRHRSKNVTLYRQGDVNYVLNAEPDSFAADFAKRHGPSACAMGLRVVDAADAFRRALAKGAKPVPTHDRPDGAQHSRDRGRRRRADLSRRSLWRQRVDLGCRFSLDGRTRPQARGRRTDRDRPSHP